MKRLHSLLILTAAATLSLSLSNSADAAAITYTLAGSGPSLGLMGSLNGTAFTATSFTFTAIGDSLGVTPFSWYGTPSTLNRVTASFSLETNIGPLAGILTAPTSDLVVGGLDFGTSRIQFLAYYDDFTSGANFGFNMDPTSGISDLSTTGSYSGFLRPNFASFTTDQGELQLNTNIEDYASTFTVGPVAAVPEPATATSSLLLSLAGLSLMSRRNRKA